MEKDCRGRTFPILKYRIKNCIYDSICAKLLQAVFLQQILNLTAVCSSSDRMLNYYGSFTASKRVFGKLIYGYTGS